MFEQNLAGYVRRDSEEPLWWPVSEHDDNELYEADPGNVVFAATQTEALERLAGMFPLPRELSLLSGVATYVCTGRAVCIKTADGYVYPRRLITMDEILFNSDDEAELALLLQHVNSVLIPNQHLKDVREEWPAEEGYYAQLITPDWADSYDYRRVTHEDEKFVRLYHDERRARRSAAAKKAATTRDSVTKDDLRRFLDSLALHLPFGLEGHGRANSWHSSSAGWIIREINRVLGIWEAVSGRHSYRDTAAYRQLMRKVLRTEKATLRKYEKYDLHAWLVVELRSNAVRRLRKNKSDDGNSYVSNRLTEPFKRSVNQLKTEEAERKRAADETKAKEEATTIDRWAWAERATEEEEKATGDGSGTTGTTQEEKEAATGGGPVSTSQEEKEAATGGDPQCRTGAAQNR